MAQAGYTPLALFFSATTGNAPGAADLVSGELAINIADGKLFYKDSTGAVQILATKYRVVQIADGTTITMNAGTTDMAWQTNTQVAGTLTIAAPTGTPVNGQKIILRLQSGAVQTFSWNGIFAGSIDLPLPAESTGGGKFDYMGFIYNSDSATWQIIAKNFGF